MSVPIWFLDVDGVVNAAGQNLPAHLLQTRATCEGTEWPIHYSADVVQFINTCARIGWVEVRWLTTWGQDARRSLAPAVGLDDFFAYDMPDEPGHGWWKAEVVRTVIESEHRPFIWTDDEIASEDVSFVSKLEPRSLLGAPDTALGLNSLDLRRIATWFERMGR